MSILKKSHLKKLRADLVKEAGGDISDEAWNEVIEKIENDYRTKLEKVLPKAFWFSMFEVAEKGDAIIEIDNVNLGDEIRRLRRINEKKVKKESEKKT